MNMKEISFSSDEGKFTRKDMDKTSKISEDYFGTLKDPSQIPTTIKTRNWIYENAKDYLNIIKNNGEIVGYAFMLPCNKGLMEDFLSKGINEAELFDGIKKIKLNRIPDVIYLCASVLKEDFRGMGIATTAFIKAINKITQNGQSKPILFYWKYSDEGERLSRRVARLTGLELRARDD